MLRACRFISYIYLYLYLFILNIVVFLALLGNYKIYILLFSFYVYVFYKNIKKAGLMSLTVEMFVTIKISYNALMMLSYPYELKKDIASSFNYNYINMQQYIYNYHASEYFICIVIFIVVFYLYRLYLEKTKPI